MSEKTTTANDRVNAMLAQYESNNKPKYEKKDKVFDLKNYFSTHLKDGVTSEVKEVRLLPTADNSTPFVEVWGHKTQVDGQWRTFACLQHEKDKPCPFCEARQELLATNEAKDKELAKKYSPRLMYVVKLIERNAEGEGVKFWRFNHDYRKTGVMDKLIGIISALKTNKDIASVDKGRDLSITINRDTNGNAVVSSIAAQDATPLSTNAEQVTEWLSDARSWEDVYSLKTYDYLEIIVKGGVPAWDKDGKKFVDKASLSTVESTNKLESELTMGVENVKASVKVANTKTSVETSVIAEDEDELPF